MTPPVQHAKQANKNDELILQRHTDMASITAVMNQFTDNGRLDELPNNSTFITTYQLAKKTTYDHSRVHFYTEASGTYLVMAEENEYQFGWCSLRMPTNGRHNFPLLRAIVAELIEVHLTTIQEQGEFLLDIDSVGMAAVMDLLDYPKTIPDGDFSYFYMNNEQCAEIMKEQFPVPEGFVEREIDEKDFQLVIDTWKYCDSHELVRRRLRHLPNVGIYTNEGQLVAFMSTHTMGQMSHQYTLPEYRGRGLGKITLGRLTQKYIEMGLRPHCHIAFNNSAVYNGYLRNPLFTQWKNDEGVPHCYNTTRIFCNAVPSDEEEVCDDFAPSDFEKSGNFESSGNFDNSGKFRTVKV